jgi:hypothetical protein
MLDPRWQCWRTVAAVIVSHKDLLGSLRLEVTERQLRSDFPGALRYAEVSIPGGLLLNLLGAALFAYR